VKARRNSARGGKNVALRRTGLIESAALLSALLTIFLYTGASAAQDQVTVPTAVGQTVTVSWQGTVLPGANASSECGQATDVGADAHAIDIAVPAGTYDSISVQGTASVAYQGSNDLIVTVVMPDGTTVSSDSGSFNTGESAAFTNPPPGTMRVIACMFAGATPQQYTGTLTLTGAAGPAPAPASCGAPGKAQQFTAPAYVDRTRAGGEPSVETHPSGTLLYASHAGTTHFFTPMVADPDSGAFGQNYRGQVYAWYSDDHGATWHYVDRTLPPDNAPGSGFSDPDFAIDTAGNTYLSEINLANVAVSKSTEAGHHYQLQNFFAQTLTDRQWKAAGPPNTVFIVGNASEGGTVPEEPAGNNGHTIYRSTDGGRTFSEGIENEGGLGDIKFDNGSGTLYEAHYQDGTLQMAAFRNALAEDIPTALTPEKITVADGVDLLSHWPAIDVDSAGNVYMVWDEGGHGSRDAGVWYSYSTDGARTWAAPTRVDPDDHTDIWPWIAVGSPGRVAISWFGNDHRLQDNNAELAGDSDPWNVYVAQTLTGLGCSKSAAPGFKTTRATPEPFHVGTVCMGGTVCQAQAVDRRLGDYFTIDVDTTGALVAAYSDTRQGGAVALPAFFRQTGGTSYLSAKKR
jgi:hypothetical protein